MTDAAVADHPVEPVDLATASTNFPATRDPPRVNKAPGDEAPDSAMTDAAVADHFVEPVDVPAVSAGVPTNLGTPHVGELLSRKHAFLPYLKTALKISSLIQARPSPRKPEVPAGRPTDPVIVVAADAGVDAHVIILDGPAPLPGTSRGRVIDNHATSVLLPDSRVGPRHPTTAALWGL